MLIEMWEQRRTISRNQNKVLWKKKKITIYFLLSRERSSGTLITDMCLQHRTIENTVYSTAIYDIIVDKSIISFEKPRHILFFLPQFLFFFFLVVITKCLIIVIGRDVDGAVH